MRLLFVADRIPTELQAIIEFLNEMEAWRFGGTAIKLGLAWGWRSISPQWRGLWGNPDLPLDYDAPLMDKVIILLTDGVQRFFDRKNFPGADPSDYTSHGRRSWDRMGVGNNNEADHRDEMNLRMANICEAVKNEGILLYTIIFQANDATLQDLFRDCATSPLHPLEVQEQRGAQIALLRLREDVQRLEVRVVHAAQDHHPIEAEVVRRVLPQDPQRVEGSSDPGLQQVKRTSRR